MFVSCGPFERRENYRIDKQLNETSELHFFGDNCQNDYKSNVSNNNEINKTKTPHKRRQRKLKLINFSNVKIIDIKTIFFSFSAKYTEIQYPWLGNVTRHFRVNSLFVFRNATSLWSHQTWQQLFRFSDINVSVLQSIETRFTHARNTVYRISPQIID